MAPEHNASLAPPLLPPTTKRNQILLHLHNRPRPPRPPLKYLQQACNLRNRYSTDLFHGADYLSLPRRAGGYLIARRPCRQSVSCIQPYRPPWPLGPSAYPLAPTKHTQSKPAQVPQAPQALHPTTRPAILFRLPTNSTPSTAARRWESIIINNNLSHPHSRTQTASPLTPPISSHDPPSPTLHPPRLQAGEASKPVSEFSSFRLFRPGCNSWFSSGTFSWSNYDRLIFFAIPSSVPSTWRSVSVDFSTTQP